MPAAEFLAHWERIYVGKYVLVDLDVDDYNLVRISRIQTWPQEARHKGHATQIMRKLGELADQHNVVLSFTPQAIGFAGMSDSQLCSWLERLGWGYVFGATEMKRLPNVSPLLCPQADS